MTRVAFAALAAVAMPSHSTARQTVMSAGLERVRDYSRSNAFADVVRQARKFGSAEAPWDGTAPVDSDGWPTGDFGVVLMANVADMAAIDGVYKVSFECATTPTINPTGATIANLQRDPISGVVTADAVFPPGASHFMLGFTGTQGGVRRLRVMRPGCEPSQQFTQPFLDHVARFRTLRFMDWTLTNGSTSRDWSDRTRPTDALYTAKSGVSWEACIDLCNAVGADCWVNVPHMATDSYVASLAALLKQRLAPGLKAYVEYSNEVWNYSYEQANWNRSEAIAEVGAGSSPLNFDASTNPGYWALRRIAKRSMEIGEIFENVYGPGSRGEKFRVVYAAQMGSPNTLRQGLKMIEAAFGPPRNYFDAFAGAPYFTLGQFASAPDPTVEQVLQGFGESIDRVATSFQFEVHAALAKWHGVEYMSYEGGPDTFGGNGIEAKRLASYDPRMRDLCVRYVREWQRHGLGEFCWYVGGASSWRSYSGTWGLTEDMTIQDTPKILAVDDAATLPSAPVDAGLALPGTHDARLVVDRPIDWPTASPYLRGLVNGAYADYLVRTEAPAAFSLAVDVAAPVAGAPLVVMVNGAEAASLVAPATGGSSVFDRLTPLRVNLDAGLNVVRLVFPSPAILNVRELAFGNPGDANADGLVDFGDLILVVAAFGETGLPGQTAGDVDGDGWVGMLDLSAVLEGFVQQP